MPHKVSKLRLPEPTVLAAYPYYLQEICSESVQNHDSENPDLLPGFSFLQKFAVLLRLVSGTLILTCRFWYADSRRAGFPYAGFGYWVRCAESSACDFSARCGAQQFACDSARGCGVLGLWRMRFST